jgi:hypothetical protein
VSRRRRGHEAYTAIRRGVLTSHEMRNNAEAETVVEVEGNMCGTDRRGADALPGSETTSRRNGLRWNLGDLVSPAIADAVPGHGRKPRRRSCRGRGEESDGCVLPVKRRTMLILVSDGGGGGKAAGRGELGTTNDVLDTAPDKRLTCVASRGAGAEWGRLNPPPNAGADHSRQEPGAGKPLAGICAGGAG